MSRFWWCDIPEDTLSWNDYQILAHIECYLMVSFISSAMSVKADDTYPEMEYLKRNPIDLEWTFANHENQHIEGSEDIHI